MAIQMPNQRTEKEIFDLILGVAKSDERVRAAYLNGSRANPEAPRDAFQDYDIVFVVRETGSFLANKAWIQVFGDIAIVQEPDANDIGHQKHTDFDRSYAWLILFQDGSRIDLTILVESAMLEVYATDSLTVPLLDKDGILPAIPPPSDCDYLVRRPSGHRYASCCNEFWWCLNNVAKGIARDELPYVMWMYHVYIQEMLMLMLEWVIGVDHDFSVSPGKGGKYFRRYLNAEDYDRYAATFADSDYDRIWKAVFAACDLFGSAARRVGSALGYTYNADEEANMRLYLEQIRNLTMDDPQTKNQTES